MVCNYVWDAAEWLGGIPPVIWSGVIGATIAAFISLVGVIAANKSSLERLRAQHLYDAEEAIKQRLHESNQNAENRKAAIRREVYTEAIEAVHELLGHFGRLPDLPLSGVKEDGPLQTFLAANSKVWLIAESEAAHLSREIASQAGEAFLTLLAAAWPLRFEMEPIRGMDSSLEHAKADIRRIEVRIAEANERGDTPEQLKPIQDSWKTTHQWVRSLEHSRNTAKAALLPKRRALIDQSMDVLNPLRETLVKLVSLLRKELDLAPDLEQFMAQHACMNRRAQAALDKAFAAD